MKYTIQSEFAPMMSALKTLKKVIPARCGIPIMEHVTVTRDALGRAVLTASDLESWLSITVDGSHCDGDFTVHRADLEKVLQGGDKGKLVLMTVDPGVNRDGTCTVTHDDVTVDLETLPVSDFPEVPTVTDTVHLPLSYHTSRDILTYCAGSMSSEETRYYLKGVYLHQFGDTGKFAAVSTDGHRLNLAETSACYAGRGVIMRDDAVKLVIDLIGKGDGAVQWHLPQTPGINGHLKVQGDGWTLVTREINGTFPHYTRVIPRDTKGKGTLPCDALSKAAQKVSRVTGKQGAGILDIAAGVFRHAGDGCSIKGMTVNVGDMFPSGDVVPVGLNPVYVTAAMQQLGDFSDTCTVYVTDAGTPLRVHPRTLPSWAENMTTVIMPMRYV
jgi:DNA polymerase III subunit beta